MYKSIYLYQDNEDICVFMEYAKSLGLEIYNCDGEQESDYFGESTYFLNFPELNICQRDVYKSPITISYIMFQRPTDSLAGLQPGRLLLSYDSEKNARSDLVSIYNKMKNYIKKEYSISDDKSHYMAPHIEKEWWDFKVLLVVSPKRRCVDFSEKNLKIEDIFDYLNSMNAHICDCGVDVHKDSPVNSKAEDFIIYTDSSKLKPLYVALNNLFICKNSQNLGDVLKSVRCPLSLSKDYRHYSSDSECIFLYKHPQKKQRDIWRMQMDERLFDGQHTDIEHIFMEISDIIKGLEN